ncbi:hypothetical protein M514_15153 [Trichuris suis]|uniref:Uncharacterized protein n=1 Tax=Trichuris suis TaxID=68888 RepID=A0A085NTF3_9BILA|nr:hypothetical protein M514_15153 [Trichuris suis]
MVVCKVTAHWWNRRQFCPIDARSKWTTRRRCFKRIANAIALKDILSVNTNDDNDSDDQLLLLPLLRRSPFSRLL